MPLFSDANGSHAPVRAVGHAAPTSSHQLSPAFPGRAPWGTAGKLRAWQQGALDTYIEKQPRDFLAVATPGAGKTTFALTLASYLLHNHLVQQITVVAPTEHLKKQWAEAAARIGIKLDPGYSSGPLSRDYHGIVVTYAGVGVNPMLHRNRTEARKTLVVMDEIHHAGDSKSWGEACFEAFERLSRRLALTGTPFRSDTNPIPFVQYEAAWRRHPQVDRRLHLRLRARARRPRRPSGDLPVLQRQHALAHQVRRRAGGPARRADDQGPHRPGLAHRALPAGRVDPLRAAGRRPTAHRGPQGDPGRRMAW